MSKYYDRFPHKIKDQKKIILLFLFNQKREFYLNEIAKIVGTSPGTSQRELNRLLAGDFITFKKKANLSIYSLNERYTLLKEVEAIVDKTFGIEIMLKFEGSDTKYSQDAVGLIALAAVTNRSPYTRFSQAGGGQLYGFEAGEAGQYRVNQALLETAVMYRGLAWQQELHWKEVDDLKNQKSTILTGNYMQLDFFFHSLWEWFPRPLEVALRHAFYYPDIDISERFSQEFSLACNWFFSGHRNKLTAEITYFDFQANPEKQAEGFRYRVQGDISF
jgi:hypothetical protein